MHKTWRDENMQVVYPTTEQWWKERQEDHFINISNMITIMAGTWTKDKQCHHYYELHKNILWAM